MAFNENSKIGELWANAEARSILLKNIPRLAEAPHLLFLSKLMTLPGYVLFNQRSLAWPEGKLQSILAELSMIPQQEAAQAEKVTPLKPVSDCVEYGSVVLTAPAVVEKWGVFEIELQTISSGNPYVDVALSAEFVQGDRRITPLGFYDGDGVYRIRFMPPEVGIWTFQTHSSSHSLNGIEGQVECTPPPPNNHGPVRVKNTFHFAYEDGTPYIPVGTTSYAWIHQGNELEEQTLQSLSASPFNKLRMCVFPKSYLYNTNEPPYYPFEGSLEQGWDYARFNPEFFRHLEQRILDLGELGIEVDLILFHSYDRWGFAEMSQSEDDRYLRYIVARLAAYRHVWWSLANEYDFMWAKNPDDWERFAGIVTENDPYHHLISIHNGVSFYDFNKPWITHCSIQRIDVYKTSEATNQWREQWQKPVVIDECAYEGDIDQGWGNITGEEMVRRFWEGAIRGGYVGHGETYLNPEEILWWAKGGNLHGSSPARIAFLRSIMEAGPAEGLNPLNSEWDLPCAGVEEEYYLFYFGFNQPKFRIFNLKPGISYKVELLDTWNMTIQELDERYEGSFRIDLPAKPYMAVRMTK
ncbi:DUF5605 domain-containing protein [Paenibacillus sp. S150]|uniref:DUF5605 domain-containing protein n=1 Tax=Paenibacillus sp. S150 TaxID=2749826 RepID=UPI001C580874|nr:DUF5605 domain-containing protein [Paenibacillus sp. S150]MBW4084344.1 DUF5605 domain-containing protein [Paenibacillus sp. S150]